MMHGKALPEPELPDGTVTVRVVREAIGNWLPGQTVQVRVDGRAVNARTDDQGRAEFSSAAARMRTCGRGDGGRRGAGIRIRSRVPSGGGLRVILIAGIAQAAERVRRQRRREQSAPPVKGVVSLGGDTPHHRRSSRTTRCSCSICSTSSTPRGRPWTSADRSS